MIFYLLYELPQIQHIEPSTSEEAAYWLAKYKDKAKIIGGGTDLLGLIKDGISGPKMPTPEVLVSTRKISEMHSISFGETDGLSLGAAVTLTQLEETQIVKERYGLLSEAAGSVATKQIRNVGTIGGNLCQRPWCWYFRNALFPCFKKGGKQCYAITGEHEYYFSVMGIGTCVMSHPSDLAPPLIALEASIHTVGSNGKRVIPIGEFFKGPKDVFENVLGEDEILTKISVPSLPANGTRGAYVKNRIRGTWDLSLASAAVLLTLKEGTCEKAKVALGGLAPYPYRSIEAEEALLNRRVTVESARIASESAMRKAKALPMTKYKTELGAVILRRAILAAAEINEPQN